MNRVPKTPTTFAPRLTPQVASIQRAWFRPGKLWKGMILAWTKALS